MNDLRSGPQLQSGARPTTLDPKVSVVMVVYHTGESLAETMAHVLAERAVDEFVIVDNGSSETEAAAMAAAARVDPRVILLTGHGNVGFAKGANMGVDAARGQAVVFVNPDAFVMPGCIDRLVATLAGRRGPCIVGACVLNPDGTEQRGGRRGEVTAITTVLSFSRLTRRTGKLAGFEIHRETESLPDEAVPMPTISGACFAVGREDFQRLQGFDEGYFLHVEDIDLCWRARRAGGEVLFQPQAKVVHLGHTSQTDPVKVEFHKGMGLARYFIKRSDSVQRMALAVVLAPAIIVTAVLRPLIWRITGRPI